MHFYNASKMQFSSYKEYLPMNIFIHTFIRDLKIYIRRPATFINPLLFFIISIFLFPLSISPESKTLITIAPGVIFVICMLSMLLSLNSIFHNDYENGVLEQIIISQQPMELIILAKTSVNWILTGLPIILISPIISNIFMIYDKSFILMLILLLTTPSLSIIGTMGASLTIGIKNSGMLLSLLILPLYIPILIFASQAVAQSNFNYISQAHIYFLLGVLLLSLISAPFISSISIKSIID